MFSKQLIHFIEQQAEMEGKQYVTCKVRSSEEGNIRMYLKLGFEIVEEETVQNILGGNIKTVSMSKAIG